MIKKEDFYPLYKQIFESNGLSEYCTEETVDKMLAMGQRMVEVNEHMNLTAITETADIIAKHLADSVISSKYMPKGATVCDVGCGGGFPTLPVALVRDDVKIVSLDSTAKKLGFVSDVAKELGFNVTTLCGRAEEIAGNSAYRESFDVVTARAVSSLDILSELSGEKEISAFVGDTSVDMNTAKAAGNPAVLLYTVYFLSPLPLVMNLKSLPGKIALSAIPAIEATARGESVI